MTEGDGTEAGAAPSHHPTDDMSTITGVAPTVSQVSEDVDENHAGVRKR